MSAPVADSGGGGGSVAAVDDDPSKSSALYSLAAAAAAGGSASLGVEDPNAMIVKQQPSDPMPPHGAPVAMPTPGAEQVAPGAPLPIAPPPGSPPGVPYVVPGAASSPQQYVAGAYGGPSSAFAPVPMMMTPPPAPPGAPDGGLPPGMPPAPYGTPMGYSASQGGMMVTPGMVLPHPPLPMPGIDPNAPPPPPIESDESADEAPPGSGRRKKRSRHSKYPSGGGYEWTPSDGAPRKRARGRPKGKWQRKGNFTVPASEQAAFAAAAAANESAAQQAVLTGSRAIRPLSATETRAAGTPSAFTCAIDACRVVCPTFETLRFHLTYHHFICTECSPSTTAGGSVPPGQPVHPPVQFKNARDLRKHRRTVHTSARMECPVAGCGYKGNAMHNLKRHLQNRHYGSQSVAPEDMRFKCLFPRCKYRSENRRNLIRHVIVKHEGVGMPFDCMPYIDRQTAFQPLLTPTVLSNLYSTHTLSQSYPKLFRLDPSSNPAGSGGVGAPPAPTGDDSPPAAPTSPPAAGAPAAAVVAPPDAAGTGGGAADAAGASDESKHDGDGGEPSATAVVAAASTSASSAGGAASEPKSSSSSSSSSGGGSGAAATAAASPTAATGSLANSWSLTGITGLGGTTVGADGRRRRKNISFPRGAEIRDILLKCEECDLGFLNEDEFDDHVWLHAPDNNTEPKLSCKLCTMEVSTENQLKEHSKRHMTQIPTSFDQFCNICFIWFPTMQGMISHREMHIVDRCGLCAVRDTRAPKARANGVPFQLSALELEAHMHPSGTSSYPSVAHTAAAGKGPPKSAADLPQVEFTSDSQDLVDRVGLHEQMGHGSHFPYICYHCGFSVETLIGIESHYKYVHHNDVSLKARHRTLPPPPPVSDPPAHARWVTPVTPTLAPPDPNDPLDTPRLSDELFPRMNAKPRRWQYRPRPSRSKAGKLLTDAKRKAESEKYTQTLSKWKTLRHTYRKPPPKSEEDLAREQKEAEDAEKGGAAKELQAPPPPAGEPGARAAPPVRFRAQQNDGSGPAIPAPMAFMPAHPSVSMNRSSSSSSSGRRRRRSIGNDSDGEPIPPPPPKRAGELMPNAFPATAVAPYGVGPPFVIYDALPPPPPPPGDPDEEARRKRHRMPTGRTYGKLHYKYQKQLRGEADDTDEEDDAGMENDNDGDKSDGSLDSAAYSESESDEDDSDSAEGGGIPEYEMTPQGDTSASQAQAAALQTRAAQTLASVSSLKSEAQRRSGVPAPPPSAAAATADDEVPSAFVPVVPSAAVGGAAASPAAAAADGDAATATNDDDASVPPAPSSTRITRKSLRSAEKNTSEKEQASADKEKSSSSSSASASSLRAQRLSKRKRDRSSRKASSSSTAAAAGGNDGVASSSSSATAASSSTKKRKKGASSSSKDLSFKCTKCTAAFDNARDWTYHRRGCN